MTFWHSAEYGSDFRLNSGEITSEVKKFAEFRVGGIPWTPYLEVGLENIYYQSMQRQEVRVSSSVADPGCFSRSRILDPNFFHPGSRIRIKEFKYFYPKKCFLTSRKYDPGCSSRIRILTFYPSRIPDPGVKKAPDPRSRCGIQGSKTHRIPDPDPQHWFLGLEKLERGAKLYKKERKQNS